MTGRAMTGRDPQAGVVLVNVLAILALTSAVLAVMLRSSDLGTRRAQTFSEAAQGLALIEAAEASARSALRRDPIDIDHGAEAWTRAAQAETEIEAGRFALQLRDAQARFNLNAIPGSGQVGPQILARLVARLDLPADTAPRILARLGQGKALTRLDQLIPEAGLSSRTLDRLEPLVTLLPGRTEINLNTAPADLVHALTETPLQAEALLEARARQGFIGPEDLAAAQVILPAGIGFRSSHFQIVTEVTVGTTRQVLTSLLQRRVSEGQVVVEVIAREGQEGRNPAAPPP